MDRGTAWRVTVGLLAMAMVGAAGVYGYNLGVAHGIAEAGRTLAAPGAGVPMVGMWPRPWGFGFGFFPFFPFLVVLCWFLVIRGLFWRGGWRRPDWHGGVPPAFDEWHRRAHAQQEPPAQTNV